MKKVRKGAAGYVRSQRVRRALVMLIMFAIPIGLYYTALAITGTQKNVLTIVAVVGLIPAARFAVSFIMIMLSREADAEAVAETEKTASALVRAYELTVTAYEGRMTFDSIVICGNEVVCCALGEKKEGLQEKTALMQKHINRILNSNGYFGSNVRIFTDLKHFGERLKQISADPEKYRSGINFKPDEKYPDLSREELMMHTIMAISV